MKLNRYSQWLYQKVAQDFSYTLSERQCEQFALYYQQLVETNRRLNLTAITEESDVYLKHFYDSLTLLKVHAFASTNNLIDIGTGAGFPGIPLKILFPDLEVVLLDSLRKRVDFLQSVVEKLALSKIKVIHGRAEDWAQKEAYREQFDLAVARAVARLSPLAEYCLPFVRVGGRFIAMKGSQVAEEVDEAAYALQVLGRAKLSLTPLALPEKKGERHLLVIEKHQHSPRKYPRKAGLPTKQPLLR